MDKTDAIGILFAIAMSSLMLNLHLWLSLRTERYFNKKAEARLDRERGLVDKALEAVIKTGADREGVKTYIRENH